MSPCHPAAGACAPLASTRTAGPAYSQHVVAHFPLVCADDREMIFTASGEEIHRTADVGGDLLRAYRIARHHELERNTRPAELRGHVDSGSAASRTTGDHALAEPASLVLLAL